MVYTSMQLHKQYGGAEPYCLISQVITKESPENFTEEEIFPIKEIGYEDPYQCGSFGTITILLKSGTVKKVNFEGLEGCMML